MISNKNINNLYSKYNKMKSNPPYYVYKIKHKLTGQFYIGVRLNNKTNFKNDFGVYYFTSSKLVKILGFHNFKIEWFKEFLNKESAYNYEQLKIKESIKNPLSLNQNFVCQTTKKKKIIPLFKK